MILESGIKAPDFIAKIDNDKLLRLNDLKGKWVVLYFYPKDNTPGCTKEACSFRDNMNLITQLDTIVIGVSRDSLSSHEKFRTKFNLSFHLISDSDEVICNSYGVIAEKMMYGRKTIGIQRSTFIIDPDGIIRFVFPKVTVDGHVEQVIKKIEELK